MPGYFMPVLTSLTRPWLILKNAAMSCWHIPVSDKVLILAAISGVTGGDLRLRGMGMIVRVSKAFSPSSADFALVPKKGSRGNPWIRPG